MFALIGIILLTLVATPVMLPAILLASVTPLTLWPTAAVIFATYLIAGALFS